MANSGTSHSVPAADLRIFAAEITIGAGCGFVSQFLDKFWPGHPAWLPPVLGWLGVAMILLGLWQVRRELVRLPSSACRRWCPDWLARRAGYVNGGWTWRLRRPWAKVGHGTDWRLRGRLEVYEIVCRSFGMLPDLHSINRSPLNERLRWLEDALRDGRLAAVRGDVRLPGPPGENGLMTQVGHADLQAFAERENHSALLSFAKEWSPPSISQINRSPPISPSTVAKPSDSFVEFAIEGDWLNTPFRFDQLPAHNALMGPSSYCEDVYVKLRSKDNLESVSVELVASPVGGKPIEYWHKIGPFNQSVTSGITHSIRLYRRTFQYNRMNNDGETFHRRVDLDTVMFDGTAAETRLKPGAVINVDIKVHHKNGPSVLGITIDANLGPVPRSTLIVYSGHAEFPFDYVRPLGAARRYGDFTE